jgi:ADP-heptose:LPS heptosyltransferase
MSCLNYILIIFKYVNFKNQPNKTNALNIMTLIRPVEKNIQQLKNLIKKKRFKDAISKGTKVLDRYPENDLIIKLVATSSVSDKNFPIAEKMLRKLVSLNKADVSIWQLLGVVLTECQKYDEAQSLFEQLFNQTGNVSILRDISRNLAYLGDFGGALSVSDKLLELRGNDRDLYENGLLQLYCGDISNGWQLYRLRKKLDTDHSKPISFKFPLWQGNKNKGIKLVVIFEQGIGDELLFSTVVHQLVKQGMKCTLVVNPRLKTLFNSNFPECSVDCYSSFNKTIASAIPSEYDYYCLAGDLFEYMRPTLASFQGTFLPLQSISSVKFPMLSGFKVGISWKGGNNDYQYNSRSILLDHLSTLFTVSDISWINLQHGEISADIQQVEDKTGKAIHVFKQASPSGDFLNYGALISQLDLVITVDNAVANFAGALGIPTLLMCSKSPFWWWRTTPDNKSLFFPSVTVFSQQSEELDWCGVIGRVHQALLNMKEMK